LKAGDTVATVGGALGTGIAVVGLFTPLAPFAAATLLTTSELLIPQFTVEFF
jgi:hypothetical protein